MRNIPACIISEMEEATARKLCGGYLNPETFEPYDEEKENGVQNPKKNESTAVAMKNVTHSAVNYVLCTFIVSRYMIELVNARLIGSVERACCRGFQRN